MGGERQQQIPFGDDNKKRKEAPLLIESGASLFVVR
jgi:hypothetical protein